MQRSRQAAGDIQETSSEGSDAYVTPAMLKQKKKRTIQRVEEKKSVSSVKKKTIHVVNSETDQAHRKEDLAKNGEDDCVSFSGQVRSSDLQHTRAAEVRQMN